MQAQPVPPALNALFNGFYSDYVRQGYDDRTARILASHTIVQLAGNANAAMANQNSAAAATAAAAVLQQHQQNRPRQQQDQQRRDYEQRLRDRERENQQHNEAAQANDEGEADADEENEVNIYEQYRPAKVTEGPNHPDVVVETASLASVIPPNITYKHHLQDVLEARKLSNAQLETILYAFQRFQRRLPDGARAGFFLGDGAGVGKGRQIAAVIAEFWASGGRRVLWVSTSNDLRFDARRDLEDLGRPDIPVYPPRKDNVPSGPLDRAYPGGGVLFVTYQLLVSKGTYRPPPGPNSKKGRSSGGSGQGGGAAAGGTATGGAARGGRGRGRGGTSAAGEGGDDTEATRILEAKRAEVRRLFGPGSRLHQLITWLGGPDGAADSLIVLDECHKAKNLLDAAGNSSQTGLAVESLQDQLPNARVLYSSATGASEPDNLRYMVRLGAFDYPHIGDMINALKRSGLGALEMFCMGLKATGTYVSRTLSYKGAEFRTEDVQIDPIFSIMYDRSCWIWSLVYNVMRALPRTKNKSGRDMKTSLYWGAHQRFYRQMLIASKVRRCAELANEAVDSRGMCVVIGLQSTGESNLNSMREAAGGTDEEGGSEDFMSAPKMILHNFISQWLFHFSEPVTAHMSTRRMQKLQSQVYRACVEWKKLLPAVLEAARRGPPQIKAERGTSNLLTAGGAAAAAAGPSAGAGASGSAAASAAGAGGAEEAAEFAMDAAAPYGNVVPKKPAPKYDELEDEDDSVGVALDSTDEEDEGVDQKGPGGIEASRAANDGSGAKAVAAGTKSGPAGSRDGGDSGSDSEVVVAGERSLDEILEEKRRRALLVGDMIDLSGADENEAGEAEMRRLLAEADAEEEAEAAAVAERKQQERRARLEAAAAEARAACESARQEVQRLEQQAAGTPARGVAAGAGAAAANGGGAYGGDCTADAPPQGHSRRAEVVKGDDSDVELEDEVKEAAKGGKAGAGPSTLGAAPQRRASTRRRCTAILDDEEDEEDRQEAAEQLGGDQEAGDVEQRNDGAEDAEEEGEQGVRRVAQKPAAGAVAASSGSSAASDQPLNANPATTPRKPDQQGAASHASGPASGLPVSEPQEAMSPPSGTQLRSPRGAAVKAAARIASTAGGTRPPLPPKGPDAPPNKVTTTAEVPTATHAKSDVAVKAEPGAGSKGGQKGKRPANGPKKDEEVIVIDSSSEEEAPAPNPHVTTTRGGKATAASAKKAPRKGAAGKGSANGSVQVKQERKAAEEVVVESEEGDEDEDDSYEDTVCTKCGGGDKPSTILLCDDCDDGYHMRCLNPPLKFVPKGDWFCPKCAAKKTAQPATRGVKRKASDISRPSAKQPAAASGGAYGGPRQGQDTAPASDDDSDVQVLPGKRIKLENGGVGAVRKGTTAAGDRRTAPAAAAGTSGQGARKKKAPLNEEVSHSDEAVDDDDEEEEEEEESESAEDSDDDDFVAVGRGEQPARRLQRGGTGAGAGSRTRAARAPTSTRLADSDEEGRPVGGVNVFKVRMQLRAARQRLKEAEEQAAAAEKSLADLVRANEKPTANGASNRRTDNSISLFSSSDSDEEEDGGGRRRGGSGSGQVTRGSARLPAEYRHAAKNKPLGKIPNSWKAGGASGSRGGSSGGGRNGKKAKGPAPQKRQGRKADSDDGDEEDDGEDDEDGDSSGGGSSDDSHSDSLSLEEEDGSEGEGEEELVEEEGFGSRPRRGQEARGSALPSELRKCRAMLLRLLDAQELPLNPLDQLIDMLGGEGRVAEMTGRKMLQVRTEDGRVVCKQRRDDEAQKMVNMAEKDDFMAGRKLIAIISDAASTGISLHADKEKSKGNLRRRLHITLELPWSADKAIQQFGRSHRSNQVSAPEYCLLVTRCGGEYRFAGAVAKRLTSLGALLRGDRRALGASSDLKPYDVDNRYGEAAVARVLECVASGHNNVAGARVPELPAELMPREAAATQPGSLARQDATMTELQRCLKTMGLLQDMGDYYLIEKKDTNTSVTKFLNRLLGLPLRDQELLFSYFFNIMESLIKQARSAGQYEEGILSLANSRVEVEEEEVVHTDLPTGATTAYMNLSVDDGLSWADAKAAMEAALADMRSERAPPAVMAKVGFYLSRRSTNVGGTGHPLVVLATALRRTTIGGSGALSYRVQRPNQVKGHVFSQYELEEKYRKVDEQTGKKHWDFWFAYLEKGCLHGNDCVRRRRDGRCNYGSRFYNLHLITGAVLPVLRILFDTVLRSGATRKTAPRVARVTIQQPAQGAVDEEDSDVVMEEPADGGAAGGSSQGPGGAAGGRGAVRVVVGLNLNERDADAFVQAVKS